MPQPTLIAVGDFLRKTKYRYGTDETTLKQQRPLPTHKLEVSSFTSVAMSDEYLAIAAKEMILVFLVGGPHAGRWLVCDEVQGSKFHSLAFSLDDSQLVVLLSSTRQDTGSFDAARIFLTSEFSLTFERQDIIPGNQLLKMVELRWQRDYMFVPRCMTFSRKGDMVAIATNHSKGEVQIKILKKDRDKGEWVFWGSRPITIHDIDHPHELRGLGVTGICLYEFPV